ncbi:MAG: winged helix-turn-helix domain-containing protein [Pseudomonadota bacterium]
MTPIPRLDILGSALADSSRARMLCELMDGRAFTNKELAAAAGVTPQTASSHLRQLADAGLTLAERSGRCTYHRIARAEVAEALETLSALAPCDHLYRGQQQKGARLQMLEARSCYAHLAGRLATDIASALNTRGLITRNDGQFRLHTDRVWDKLGVSLPANATARACLDWTERKPHIGGSVGQQLLNHALSSGWLKRQKQARGMTITQAGRRAYLELLGVQCPG